MNIIGLRGGQEAITCVNIQDNTWHFQISTILLVQKMLLYIYNHLTTKHFTCGRL